MGKFDVFANVTLVTPTRHADQIFDQVVPGADADCVACASRLPNDAGFVCKVRSPGRGVTCTSSTPSLTAAVAGRRGGNGAGEYGQGDPPVSGEASTRLRS